MARGRGGARRPRRPRPHSRGNFAPTNTVAPAVARELDANVLALADLDEYARLPNERLHEAGVEYQEPVIHAGAAGATVVLTVDGDLVRTDAYEPGYEGEVSASRLLGEAIRERVTGAYAERVESERAPVAGGD